MSAAVKCDQCGAVSHVSVSGWRHVVLVNQVQASPGLDLCSPRCAADYFAKVAEDAARREAKVSAVVDAWATQADGSATA